MRRYVGDNSIQVLTCGSIAQKIGDELRRVSARTIAIFFLLIIVRSSAVNVRLLPEYVCQDCKLVMKHTTTGPRRKFQEYWEIPGAGKPSIAYHFVGIYEE